MINHFCAPLFRHTHNYWYVADMCDYRKYISETIHFLSPLLSFRCDICINSLVYSIVVIFYRIYSSSSLWFEEKSERV